MTDLFFVQKVYRKIFSNFSWGPKLKSLILPIHHKFFTKAKVFSPVQHRTFRMVWYAENLHTKEFIGYSNNGLDAADEIAIDGLSTSLSAEKSELITVVDECVLTGGSRFISRNGMVSLDIARSPVDLAQLYKDYYFQEEVLGIASYDPKLLTIRLNIAPSQMQLLGHWVSILHSTSDNWMHFLAEGASKLHLATENVKDLPFGILFDENLPPSAWEVIQLLSGGRPMIGIPHGFSVKVSHLVVPVENVPTCSAVWPRNNGFCGIGFFDFDSDALISLRFKIFRHFSIIPKCTRSIYIDRKSTFRHIVNQSEVEKVLLGQGFESISPGKMSLKEQVKVFSEASVVVAQAGAALANMMFMPSGSKVICLVGDSEWLNYGYFQQYAEIFGLDFIYVQGCVHDPDSYDDSKVGTINHPYNSEFELPVGELLKVLERV